MRKSVAGLVMSAALGAAVISGVPGEHRSTGFTSVAAAKGDTSDYWSVDSVAAALPVTAV
ncbi:hypothetical protein [Saccharothrix algeriensis]|uniref:Uncharacterized protein n=1 Tax=Saccharothrix algeriensis TaxID=173560 RepID=A0A8T8HZ56_9PSEU|nr:hypothetical protein [Saccharothrix algeriensis]MBM7809614.1 hypothetical protein [Saccharothrix algeriensis]QTR03923.1 hypothetical protein J7S33_02530 [Saccharothrix algeriensis]